MFRDGFDHMFVFFDLCNMIFSLFLYLVSGLFIVCSVINNIPYFAYVYVVAGIS